MNTKHQRNTTVNRLKKAIVLFMAAVMTLLFIPQSLAHELFERYEYVEFTIDLSEQNTHSKYESKVTGSTFKNSYYDQLSKVEREVYSARMKSMATIRKGTAQNVEFTVNNRVTVEEFTDACFNALAAFDYDHPEYFWVSRTLRVGAAYNPDNRVVIKGRFVRPDTGWYISDYETKDEVIAAEDALEIRVNEIVSEAKGTVYDKLIYFHDWLVNNNDYNRYVVAGDMDSVRELAWCAASALIGDADSAADDPVCEGYSRAFKLLCDIAGIPCVVAVGEAGGGAHMWNYVKMHNTMWYAVDITWDDPVSDEPMLLHSFFLKGSRSFFERHEEDGDFIGRGTFKYPKLCEYDYPQELGGALGDVSGTGKIDVGCATLILRYTVGLYEIPKERLPYADFNCSGVVNVADATLILRYVVSE